MTQKKDDKIIEGEYKKGKTKPKDPKQFVSEKMVGIIIGLIVLISIGYFAYDPVADWWNGLFEDEVQTAEVIPETKTDPRDEEIRLLKERLAALENRPVQETDQSLEARLAALENNIETLGEGEGEGTSVVTPDPRIENLEAELAALREELNKKPEPSPRPDATFAQAVAALSPPLYQSLSYEGQLEQIRILAIEMPALNQAFLAEPLSTLSHYSKTGVPTLNDLQTRFERASIEALKAEGLDEDAGWWDKTWARIKGVVVVKSNDGSGSPLEAALAEAEAHLKAGNLAEAIALVEGLPPQEAAAFDPWAEGARQRKQALDAYRQLVDFIARQNVSRVAE